MESRAVRPRPGGRSARVRAAVMAATLETLAEVGPAGFTVAAVAARAGVHETSIYRRWGSRERLALEAATELSTSLLPIPDTGTIRGDLIAFGRSLVEYLETPLGQALARMMAGSADDEALAGARAEFWHERRRESAVIVERAVARGELAEATDAALMIECFVGPVHFRLLLTREPVDEAYLAHLADVAVAASCPPGR